MLPEEETDALSESPKESGSSASIEIVVQHLPQTLGTSDSYGQVSEELELQPLFHADPFSCSKT